MRTLIVKFATLAVAGLMAIGTVSVSPARAQTQDQINAAVNAAMSGTNPTALATFLATYPNAAVALGDVVAGTLNAGGPGTTALAAALVATGNVGLISGVLVVSNTAAQAAVAAPLAASSNTNLAADVQVSLAKSGSSAAAGAMAAINTAASNAGTQASIVAVITNIVATPPVIPIPSPAVIVAGSPS